MPSKYIKKKKRRPGKSGIIGGLRYGGQDTWSKQVITNKPKEKGIPAFYFSSAWKDLRTATLKRDNHICRYCGAKGIQADHIIPRKRDGPDTLENLVACCVACNEVAGGRVFTSFSRKRDWVRDQRKV